MEEKSLLAGGWVNSHLVDQVCVGGQLFIKGGSI
jgi:hypothetical protein